MTMLTLGALSPATTAPRARPSTSSYAPSVVELRSTTANVSTTTKPSPPPMAPTAPGAAARTATHSAPQPPPPPPAVRWWHRVSSLASAVQPSNDTAASTTDDKHQTPTTTATPEQVRTRSCKADSIRPVRRRDCLLAAAAAACLVPLQGPSSAWAADGASTSASSAASAAAIPPRGVVGRGAVDLRTLQDEAYLAYAERRFQDAVNLLTEVIGAEPEQERWWEMRAQALVDGKNFSAALTDFENALRLTPEGDLVTRARLMSGRALAWEGLSDWEAALVDYRTGSELATAAGESPDPYVINSIGNCFNSLGRWEEAREQYLASAAVFQSARGFRGRNGSTTPRLDGAVFAASNAALMRAQLGDTDGAVQEMVRIARRAPGSADMRAALAALYWSQGRRQDAEEMWQFACDRITVGCTKYSDLQWLRFIRRWPPVMVDRMADFLALQ